MTFMQRNVSVALKFTFCHVCMKTVLWCVRWKTNETKWPQITNLLAFNTLFSQLSISQEIERLVTIWLKTAAQEKMEKGRVWSSPVSLLFTTFAFFISLCSITMFGFYILNDLHFAEAFLLLLMILFMLEIDTRTVLNVISFAILILDFTINYSDFMDTQPEYEKVLINSVTITVNVFLSRTCDDYIVSLGCDITTQTVKITTHFP